MATPRLGNVRSRRPDIDDILGWKKMEMKYVGYSVKKLIEETLKEGFREEQNYPILPRIKVFTKLVNGIAYKLRWIDSVPELPMSLVAPEYLEKEVKLVEKKQETKRKKLRSVTTAKRGINWDEWIIGYDIEKFDNMLNELRKLCAEQYKKDEMLEERWEIVKNKFWDKVKDKLRDKRVSSEVWEEMELENEMPFYLSSDAVLKWKDSICEKIYEDAEAMLNTFYNKYRDFISSTVVEPIEPLGYLFLAEPFTKRPSSPNRFIIGGYSSRKELDRILSFVKLYNKAFSHGLEGRAPGRPGYSFRDWVRVSQIFKKFKEKFEKIQTDIRKERQLLPKNCSDIPRRKMNAIARKHSVGLKVVESIGKLGGGAYKTALEHTATYFKKHKSSLGETIGKSQVYKMISSKSYKNRFKFGN